MSGGPPPRWRLPFLLAGMLALAGGIVTGLLRMGWALPAPGAASVADHAPLMIGAFFGTVIGLERAVALGSAWAYLAPACAGLGGLALLAGAPAAPALLGAGSLVFLAASLRIRTRQRALHTLVLALGAAAWAAGNGLWLAGNPVPFLVPLWSAFLVVTIAGERLELTRFLPPAPGARRLFGAIVAALLAGALATPVAPRLAPSLWAAALLALALWLLGNDIARRTVRERGLTRYIAVCLLSGYAWLAAGALLLVVPGALQPGSAAYDAGLHALLLGFVFPMVFGHAPVIVPAVLGARLPYHAAFYGPLAALHASLVVRVAGTLAGDAAVRGAGGALNAAAIALFVLTMLAAAVRGSRGQRA